MIWIWMTVYLGWAAAMLYLAYQASEFPKTSTTLTLVSVAGVGAASLMALSDWTV